MRSQFLPTLMLFAASCFAATPAELAVKQAEANIKQQPSYCGHYNALATAYVRRARETSDAQFLAKAEETLRQSFAIEPDNFDGRKVETLLQLERHEYARALESATKLNKMVPDDVSVYGYLVDADMALGNDHQAIDAAQWMLNLRPGNVGGFIHAAHLRELHGNLPGALDLLQMAYNATPPSETEDRAWILTQSSHLELLTGDLLKAESFATDALGLFPDYHYGLAALAQVRLAQGRDSEALTLLRKRYDAAPSSENLYALAEAQDLAGQHEEAQASYGKFATMSGDSRELILYYVDHAGEPAKALELARHEIAQRHDVFTLDSYAWALAANGDYAEADRQIQAALHVGVKDQTVLHHAEIIARHLHRND